jgi:HTH-like domain
MSRAQRRALVERTDPALPVSQQCRLLAVSRSSVYRRRAAVGGEDRSIMALIDRHYLARPYYGSRRMAAWLATQGHLVNRKRVQRLMRLMGLVAIYQRPNTSKAAAEHKIYPYLLSGIVIERVNQVWCSDVTYILMAKGFDYLVVVMDWVSRAVLGGDCRTRSAPIFVSRRWRRRSADAAGPRFSIPTRACPRESGGQSVHQRRFHRHAEGSRDHHQHGRQEPALAKAGGRCMATSSSSGCGAASNTRRSTSTPMRVWPRPKPVSAPGSISTMRSASTRASAIARRGKFTMKACGYVDDRLCRPAPLPPPPEPARKAGKCSPSPTYPQAPQPTKNLMLMK